MIDTNILSIEINTTCQLSCPLCPTKSWGQDKLCGQGYLKFNDLKAMLEANPRIDQLVFKSTGEIFLNPEILSILKYCYEKRIRVNGTNGSNLNTVSDEVLEGLVKYRVQELVCSIDGATQETYERYRVGGDLAKVLANVRRINEYKRKYHSRYPLLNWQMIAFGHNEHEIPAAKKMAKKLKMRFYLKMCWNDDFSPVQEKDLIKREMKCVAATRRELEAIKKRSYHNFCCRSLWLRPRINWDGRVIGCDVNRWGDYGSNIFRDGFLPAINSEKIEYARRMLLGEVPPRDDIPCFNCQVYNFRREQGRPLKLSDVYYTSQLWDKVAYRIYFHPALNGLFRFIYKYSGVLWLRNSLKKIRGL